MSVGSKGNGPGEYLATSTFFINHYTNSINILDPVKLALHIYDLDGNYIESMMFNELFVAHIKGVVMLDKETIVCFTNPNFHMESGYFIVNLSNLSVKTTIYKYPLKITGHISFAIAEHPYSVFNNEIHFVIPFSNSVNCHGNHSTNMLYNIINGREEINTEQLLKFADQYNNDYIDIIKNCVKDDKYSVGFKNYYETDRYICVDYYIKGMLSQALLYDKKHKESYIIDDYSTFTPDFGSIINSSRNTLIKVWKNDQIIGFKQNLDNGNISKTQYSPDILQLVENYTEDDNPVIILYQMNN
jgi:hypothetical protein